MKNHPESQRGVTLIEAAVAMTIGAIALSTAAPGFRSLVERKRLEGVAAQLATDLQFVRTAAVARNEPLRISFYAETGGSCYVMHTGAAGDCGCTAESASTSRR